MQGADGLQIVAEVSLGLAGFTGVVLFLTREPGRWHAFDSVRIFGLLTVSLATLVLSILPFGLAYAGLEGSALWRSSSAAAFLILAPVIVAWLDRTRRLTPDERGSFRPAVFVVLAAGHVLALLVQALNALAIGFSGSLAPFFLGLLWNVAYSAAGFYLIIFRRPQ